MVMVLSLIRGMLGVSLCSMFNLVDINSRQFVDLL